LSDLTDFFIRYAENRLGRPLSESESGDVAHLNSRKAVNAFCAAIVAKPKAKPKSKPKKKVSDSNGEEANKSKDGEIIE